jgi:hemoglobin/transferrin/lactoferrin receptor protein
VHNASKNIILKTNLSSGFRVPNIDDLAKIFESGGGKIIVPNNNLAPEKTITTDIGFILKTESNRHLLEGTYFYTKMYDAIVTDKFTYGGASTLMYNGTLSEVYANQNKGRAYVTGFNLAFKSTLTSSLTFDGSYSYTLGRVIETTNRPLDHIPPYFGRIGLNYSREWGMVEAYLLFNGKKDIADYSTSGEDNPQYAPSTGMPAWETYNIKASSKDMYGFKFYAGVENILDTQYRTFASGINAPGRNIYGGAKYSF